MPARPADSALGAEEAAALFAPLAAAPAVALAVSGGADSLALLHLAARWRAGLPRGPGLLVLTVDHGLRPESQAETAMVAGIAARHGLPSEGLAWPGPHPATGIEEAARTARYALLAAAATRFGATHLVTAHHEDDQAETFLMRLARGSGIDGLAAMRAARPLAPGLTLFRPFLAVPKARLVATCREAGLAFVEDPMNRDPRFARARLRALLPALAAEGLTAPAIARAAARFARATEALEHATGALLQKAAVVDDRGAARLAAARLAEAPEEIRLRVLARILAAVGGGTARAERLEGLERAIASGRPFRRTLAGATIMNSDGEVAVWREAGRRGLPTMMLDSPHPVLWDNRFRVSLAGPWPDARLGPLGADSRSLGRGSSDRAIVATTPALRIDDEVVAAPLAGIFPPPQSGLAMTAESLVAARLGLSSGPPPFTLPNGPG